jgi:hypothetical protein
MIRGRSFGIVLGAVLLLGPAAPIVTATPSSPGLAWTSVELSFKPHDSAAHAWTVHIDANGSGTYTEQSSTSSAPMPLTVSATTMDRLRRGEHAVKSGHCETKAKNIAQTGEKSIRYDLPDHPLACTFNYSDDAGLMDTFAAFQGIAETMQAGERLEHDQRFDRLALDSEMESFVSSVRSGSAIEVGNISAILQSLIADDHVIDRVRRNAARLLQDSGLAAPSDGTGPNE